MLPLHRAVFLPRSQPCLTRAANPDRQEYGEGGRGGRGPGEQLFPSWGAAVQSITGRRPLPAATSSGCLKMPRSLLLVTGAYVLICCGCVDALTSDSAVVCPALSDPTRIIECKVNGTNVDCMRSMVPGTEAVAQCGLFYTHVKLHTLFIQCQPNGTWSREITPCVPKCGEINPFRGYHYWWYLSKETTALMIPWHAGVYLKIEGKMALLCGGTIISDRVIVTAAQCFWDPSSSQQKDQKLFKIAAGKYYHEWDADELYVQKPEIDKIILHPRFRGHQGNWMSDISVVKLKEPLLMSYTIRPICVDFDRQYETLFVPGKTGVVFGWGGNQTETYSKELRQSILPYVSTDVCEKEVPDTFLVFLTIDKFCAGYPNGKGVCPGDSGGGYTMQFSDGKWYLMGVVSVGVRAPDGSICNVFSYTAYTKISSYYDFISSLL